MSGTGRNAQGVARSAGSRALATATPPQREGPTSSTLSAGAFTLCGRPDAYGRHVSRPVENRTAVFASQPQSVEVFQAGAWWAGELLGWRHGDDGACQVWVRVVLAGVEETAWTDLAALRLPERHLAVAPELSAPRDASSTQKLPRATSPRRERSGDEAATASMPMVRDLTVVGGGAPRAGGRRRAPEAPNTVVADVPSAPRPGGRRRAPEAPETVVADAPAAPRSGGRRRAPEAPETVVAAAETPAPSSGGKRRAPDAASTDAPETAPPVDPGRHRKADTGLFPAITAATPAVSAKSVPAKNAPPALPARPSRLDDTFGGRSRSAWKAVGEPEPELLTRPMRLSDHVPHARRPRLDGSLTGV